MSEPIEQQIIQAVKARLQAITVAGGYRTDAGERVYLGKPFDERHDTFPAIVVWIVDPVTIAGPASPGHLPRQLVITIEGLVDATNRDDPLVEAIRLARDIKEALYRLDDLRLVEGHTSDLAIVEDRYVPAERGRKAASAEITIHVPYFEKFTRRA